MIRQVKNRQRWQFLTLIYTLISVYHTELIVKFTNLRCIASLVVPSSCNTFAMIGFNFPITGEISQPAPSSSKMVARNPRQTIFDLPRLDAGTIDRSSLSLLLWREGK